jgi:hypothetical protein
MVVPNLWPSVYYIISTIARIQGVLQRKDNYTLGQSFKISFRYIDNNISINNSRLNDLLDRIYTNDLEIKDTTYILKSVSCLDHYMEVDDAD